MRNLQFLLFEMHHFYFFFAFLEKVAMSSCGGPERQTLECLKKCVFKTKNEVEGTPQSASRKAIWENQKNGRKEKETAEKSDYHQARRTTDVCGRSGR